MTRRGAVVFAELYPRQVNWTYLLGWVGGYFALNWGRKRRREAGLLYVYFLIGWRCLIIAYLIRTLWDMISDWSALADALLALLAERWLCYVNVILVILRLVRTVSTSVKQI